MPITSVEKQYGTTKKWNHAFFVYYAPDINVINKEYDPIFKDLPGLPVQYEFTQGKLTFLYTLSLMVNLLNRFQIQLNLIPKSSDIG